MESKEADCKYSLPNGYLISFFVSGLLLSNSQSAGLAADVDGVLTGFQGHIDLHDAPVVAADGEDLLSHDFAVGN